MYDLFDDAIHGMLSFMITVEDNFPVLYIYEIHMSRFARGTGIGGHLMRMVEGIAREAGLAKTMLTSFTKEFWTVETYRHLGYTEDEYSPEARELRGKVVKPDYIIMSKTMTG